jgi:hypothetical protein
LLGNSDEGRESLVLEASTRTALREGNWLMIPPYKGPAVAAQVNIELGNSPDFQLYNLTDDIGQQQNMAKSHPEQLNLMIEHYKAIVGDLNSNVEALELK